MDEPGWLNKFRRAAKAGFYTDYTTEPSVWPLSVALMLTAAITLVGNLYIDYLGLTNIGMLYLLPVVFASARMGVTPSVFVALVSVFCWDIFFVPPILQLAVSDPRQLITFLVFMLVAYYLFLDYP